MISIALVLCIQAPNPVEVDQAIKKGVAYLKEEHEKLRPWKQEGREMATDELILWTFVHALVPEDDPLFQKLLKEMLSRDLEVTYRVALQAMILEELHRVNYQARIAQCAQFLIDNQTKDGRFNYGDPTLLAKDVPTGRSDVATGMKVGENGRREKPKVRRFISIKQQRVLPAGGDNSNAQYAALGLRACHDAGIVIPREVTLRACRWWEQEQNDDGGWCYRDKGDLPSWGSMSAGGFGSLVICKYLLGEKWKNDRHVAAGLKWLASNYSVEGNPGRTPEPDPMWHFYYYIYAFERAMELYGTDTIAGHRWYDEGAKVLLERQRDDGAWVSPYKKIGEQHHVYDTCFAILFLKRATRPLEDVATK